MVDVVSQLRLRNFGDLGTLSVVCFASDILQVHHISGMFDLLT